MELSAIRIPLNARGPWSAVDLGFTLARHWWLPLFLVWLIPSMLVYWLLMLAFSDTPWVALLVVWWLKPFWDQLNLYMGSRLIFGQKIGVMETLKSGFSVVKKDWWKWLTFRRLSMTRSFDMPITTLEQLGGEARSNRKAVLHQTGSGAPFWLTILTLHLEYILTYGFLMLLYLMVPEFVDVDWNVLFFEDATVLSSLSNSLLCISMAALAPFYTMSGFVLYLNRRIELEGWDIELQFRQLAERLKGVAFKSKTANVAVVLFALFSLNIASPNSAIANTSADTVTVLTSESSKKRIEKVLEGDAFHQKHTSSTWQRKDATKKDTDNEPPKWLQNLFEHMSSAAKAIRALGAVIEVAFWLAIAGLVVYLIYRYRKEIQSMSRFFRKQKKKTEAPKVLFGLDVTEENLPENVLNEVRALWESGQKRNAISLLYRASLSKLIHEHACPFQSSDTESECVEKVSALGLEKTSSFLSMLTEVWQSIAYGHLDVSSDRFVELCDRWEEVLA